MPRAIDRWRSVFEHAEIVAARLREEGYRVERAPTGPDAIARLESEPELGALVVDFRLPAMCAYPA